MRNLFESLESRQMLSASPVAVYADHGVLRITGSERNDVIVVEISDNPFDKGGAPTTVVKIGKKGGTEFRFTEVFTGVEIAGMAGNDNISVELHGSGNKPDINVQGHAGKDTLIARLFGSNRQGRVSLNGDLDNDKLSVTALGSEQGIGSWSGIEAYGGDGNDQIVVNADTTVHMHGGIGKDKLTVLRSVVGPWHHLDGGLGNDRFENLSLSPISMYDAGGNNTFRTSSSDYVSLNGPGNNSVSGPANVSIYNQLVRLKFKTVEDASLSIYSDFAPIKWPELKGPIHVSVWGSGFGGKG